MELDYVVDVGLDWRRGRVKRTITDHVQIHHTVGNYDTAAKIKGLHENKISDGNRGIGYSYVIAKDGTILLGRGLEYAHGGVKDSITNKANQRSVSIAFSGDMREAGLPTAKQISSFVRLCNDILAIYDLSTGAVIGHNEVPVYKKDTDIPTGGSYATLCPCMDMDEMRKLLREETNKPDLTIPEDEEITEELPAYPALYQYVGSSFVNLRAMASTGGQKIGTVRKGEKVIVLSVQGDWAEVIKHEDVPMLRGWCISKYLQEV